MTIAPIRPDGASSLDDSGAPPPPPSPREPSAIDQGVLRVDESLRHFIAASSDRARSTDEPGDAAVDTARAAQIRAFFSQFDVEVPITGGAPGQTRKVAVPFRISLNAFERHARNLAVALGQAPSRAYVGLVVSGRATPAQLAAVVRDLARLHPAEFAADRAAEDVRNYLRSNGVGIDCAGAVQLALLDLQGLASDAGARLGLRRRLDEDLTRLSGNPHFRKLAHPEALRPGDLVILDPPENDAVGHTVIVTGASRGPLTNEDAAALAELFPELDVPGRDVVRIEVASSFGWDGPQERTWVYDPSSGAWGDLGGHLFDDDGHGQSTPTPGPHSGPWDHTIRGMYRAR
jgi:hypothetical protein